MTLQKLYNITMFVIILRLTATNSISDWAAPQTLLGELTLIIGPLAVFKGPFSKGRKGKGEKGEEGARKSVKHRACKVVGIRS